MDAVGAGDALLAYASLSLKISNSVLIASILGSISAACECEKDGNVTIDPKEVIENKPNRRVNKIFNKVKIMKAIVIGMGVQK